MEGLRGVANERHPPRPSSPAGAAGGRAARQCVRAPRDGTGSEARHVRRAVWGQAAASDADGDRGVDRPVPLSHTRRTGSGTVRSTHATDGRSNFRGAVRFSSPLAHLARETKMQDPTARRASSYPCVSSSGRRAAPRRSENTPRGSRPVEARAEAHPGPCKLDPSLSSPALGGGRGGVLSSWGAPKRL